MEYVLHKGSPLYFPAGVHTRGKAPNQGGIEYFDSSTYVLKGSEKQARHSLALTIGHQTQ